LKLAYRTHVLRDLPVADQEFQNHWAVGTIGIELFILSRKTLADSLRKLQAAERKQNKEAC